jgi:chorismate dehydratase
VTRTRLGVVAYLNAQPLAFGLDRQPERFALTLDVPARCARLLHEGAIDLGTIPSIEVLRGGPYAVVPGIAIGCDGAIESVAIFSSRPIASVRTLALDTTSRTSVALAQVLCAKHFGIAPELRPMAQDPRAMLEACDAAVVIGDAALFFDHEAAGVQKIDLGTAWRDYTGLPFVFALWAGRPGAIDADVVARLQAVRDAAVAVPDAVASAFFGAGDTRVPRGSRYLRDNVKFGCHERELAGVHRFYREAAALGLLPEARDLRFY